MEDEMILRKAIEKAVKNGLVLPHKAHWTEDKYVFFSDMRDSKDIIKMSVNDIIFSHDFAQAFFGEGKDLRLRVLHEGGDDYLQSFIPAWQYHLQQLVISENPLSYIAKFIN